MWSLCLGVFAATPVDGDEVHTRNQRANKLYARGKYEQALKLYDDALLESPSNPRLKMNRGSALHNMGQFDQAEESYKEALSEKDRNALADLHYNLGNTLFREGQQAATQGAQQKLQGALDEYIRTLDIRPSDKDAKWNLQLTEAVLEQLKKQQQNQQDRKDQDKQQNKRDQKQAQDQKDRRDKQQQPMPQPSQEQKDMKKEQAAQLLAQFSDDADSLNKPMRRVLGARAKKIEKDW